MEIKDVGLWLEKSSRSPFWNSAMIFAILQTFGNYPVVKNRFIKYDIRAGMASAQFFNINVGKP